MIYEFSKKTAEKSALAARREACRSGTEFCDVKKVSYPHRIGCRLTLSCPYCGGVGERRVAACLPPDGSKAGRVQNACAGAGDVKNFYNTPG